MKVIKNINNNTCICLDSNNREIVAFGNGIGFKKPPYEVDISKVQRTFYDVESDFVQMLHLIPDEIFDMSMKIVDYAQMKLENLTSANIVFTLADHINFALKRYEENMKMPMPISYDIQHLYEKEYQIGKYAIQLINEYKSVHLSKEEVTGIALHLINAQAIDKDRNEKTSEYEGNERILEDITSIIEKTFEINIEKESFNYSRFVSHIQYLLKRGKRGESINSDNQAMFAELVQMFPKCYECAKEINQYLWKRCHYIFHDEELLYLMLHINRLCSREESL